MHCVTITACVSLFISCAWIVPINQLHAAETNSSTDYSTDTNGYDWGNTVGGFQMAVSLDQTNGIVHCWIRNATTNELDYSSFDVGYFENIKVQIQGANGWTNWQANVIPGMNVAWSGDPTMFKRIKPLQIITDTYNRSHPQHETVKSLDDWLKVVRYTHGSTNEALATEEFNKRLADRNALVAQLGQKDTFTLDLYRGGRSRPSLTDQEQVTVRVSEKFRTKPEEMVTLYSPTFTVEKSFLQACILHNLDPH